MRKSILGATLVALLGGTAMVSAQQGPAPGGGGNEQPSMKQQGGTPGGSGGSEKSTQQRAPEGNGRTTEGSKGEAPRAQGSGSEKGSASTRSENNREGPARAEKSEKSDRQDRKGTAQSDDGRKGSTAEPKDKAGEPRKSAEPKEKSDQMKGKTAEPKERAGDQRQDRAQSREGQQGKQARSREDERKAQRTQVTQEQRTRIQQALVKHPEVRVTNVHFPIRVGARVPRNVRLHVLPPEVVAILPAYRGYRFVVVDDRICIVRPRSAEIVQVLDMTSGPVRGRPVMATLHLTQPQIAMILERVPADRARSDVRIDLALGAEVPSSVELYEFPEPIIAEVPELRRYRYLVLDREVVIIDPSNRGVIQVLNR